jgi:CDGSH iron-sulfur domain-containing protein 3
MGTKMADEGFIADMNPYLVEVEAGKTYFWCACGRSARQPFCDGSHAGTDKSPIAFKAEHSEAVNFCGCKQSGNPPFCDGSHNIL